ncbi:MAG: signal peptide peptidase SppA [Deltaproteobacteria bacterium]|nr:signal peptide peptidase SppA [bacterium]MCB9476543.1 signal peptide peptidase SppA [Deltaproteobacteria bacterium]MCB9489469.1 signal peptide peptidase SppA [Deltaproteobacteria bacterium]
MRRILKKILRFAVLVPVFLIDRLFARWRHYRVVSLRIRGSYPEIQPVSAWRFFSRAKTSYPQLVRRLEMARLDPKVEAAIVTISDNRLGLARAQEVARLIGALRESGKKVTCVLEGGGLRDYLIAAQADKIVLPPPSSLFITGLAMESVFLGDLLKKLDVEADLLNEGKYKNAAEMFTRNGPTKYARQMMDDLVQGLHGELTAMIASGRGVSAETVTAWIDGAPYTSKEAKAAGIVDEVAYRDEVLKAHRKKYGKKMTIPLQKQARYAERARMLRAMLENEPQVAVLVAAGPIVEKSNDRGSVNISPRQLVEVIDALRKNDDIKAVVLRVSSPGGSAFASDIIHRALERLKKKKPVIVSMGDVAASGGYYLSMAGTVIFAEGATVAGSIGVISGKVSLKGLYEKLGVKKERYAIGQNAGILSDYGTFTDSERERMRSLNHQFYLDFKRKVGAARGLSAQKVEAAAQGRVFTGTEAMRLNLVDAAGGLADALAEASKRAGTRPGKDAQVLMVEYLRAPFVPSPSLGGFSESAKVFSGASALLPDVAPLVGLVRILAKAPAMLLPFWVRSSDGDLW